MKNIPIGEVLKEYGYITEEQLQQALAAQKQNRSRRLGEILEDMGFVTERQKLEALGQRMGLPVVDLATYEVDTDAVAKIPKQLALRHGVIAVAQQGGHLVVATSDPLNFYGTEEVRQITGMPVDSLLAEKAPIDAAIAHYYAEIGAKLAAEQANKDVEPLPISPIEVEEGEGDAPVVKLLASLLDRGYNSGASDIHVEPFEQQTSVRMRLDGVIVDFVTLSPAIHPSLITRIKILAGLDIAERRQPQDGHFRQKVDGQDVNIRVSIIPTIYGEKAVLRFLNQNTPIDRAGQFGMDDDNYQKFSQMLRSPHGIIYMTGPTGSGKTTTLYMILEQMAQRTLNISTIEDPVERDIFRINQMQVNTAAGLTFDAGLRALLRQDPDVIMVGETRDSETASISVRAAITGHLVFSTLHTNDALSAIVRLQDMGLPAYMVANSLVGIVAQRLVRKVCPHCAEEYAPDETERAALGVDLPRLRRGKGCHICGHTGYKGRIAIHEVAVVDRQIRRMISAGAAMDDITQYARESQGMRTLRDSALQLVKNGVTTVDEFLKVTYYAD
ncbi:GspE/PulE family protein [Bittarella massiliensis (ex Durand et al. 2017)]|uniref:GspE/PulE family protein n=1 Tax=Bittarella massiliensis (ex Durand et al. 2017) TaxID=1720313 RepID=A0AAW5K9N0_9FIRM|nr:GspE/PulE family protein [Bittarella massiliensis (ex Durand et al. 2017)]MBC2871460.1 type II/IV secretion system protein [Bittarella massiliensis (ex Durand et al. 2017)]MCQ4949562.1 GspE/PulE family protein [Bittarella massiliensis (ex Durand et al. 2017)]